MASLDKISKNNTRIIYHPDGSVKMVVLHNTVIYESSPVREDGSRVIAISNGGYNTATTQTRLNQIFIAEKLPLYYRRKGGGYVVSTTYMGDGIRELPVPRHGALLIERDSIGQYSWC